MYGHVIILVLTLCNGVHGKTDENINETERQMIVSAENALNNTMVVPFRNTPIPRRSLETSLYSPTIKRLEHGSRTVLHKQTVDDFENTLWTGYTLEITTRASDVITGINIAQSHSNNSYDEEKCFTYYVLIRNRSIAYTSTALTVEVLIVNSMVLIIFLQKKHRSPLTILLSCLAISDALTALLFCIPELIVLLSGKLIEGAYGVLWSQIYPSCIIVSLCKISGFVFHQMSIFLTAALSAQKLISIMCPLWSRIHLKNKAAIVTSLLASVISLLLYLPLLLAQLYTYKAGDEICCNTKFDANPIFFTTVVQKVIYVLCILVVLTCTVLLSCKLTCFKKSLPGLDTQSVQRRNRRSAIIVVIISIIFILSELITIMEYLYYLGPDFSLVSVDILDVFVQYKLLSLQIGFSLNFIVYLALGQQLRKTLSTGLRDICTRCFKT